MTIWMEGGLSLDELVAEQMYHVMLRGGLQKIASK